MTHSSSQLNSKDSSIERIQTHKILTGIKPTGDIHLGNFFGGLKPAIDLSHTSNQNVILMCADLHGLTNRSEIFTPGNYSKKTLAAIIALGFNTKDHSLILQSDFPQILKISWLLGCTSSSGLLERSHAYKDALQNGRDATCGLLFYPVLMAADIITFDTDIVPVGKDQSQHLEYASDMAKSFNHTVNSQVFKEPKALIQETPTLIGIDGTRKMSKSYNNQIPLFAPIKEVEKKIKEIKTDSKGLNDPKNPDDCPIFQIFQSFASPEATRYMKEKLENGTGYGYGHAKSDFFEEFKRVFHTKREIFEENLNDPHLLRNTLESGYKKACTLADSVVNRAYSTLGLFHHI